MAEVKSPTYRVVELTAVTDESLEQCLNEYSQQGYLLDGIHFAMRESSKRPAMAFVLFTGPSPRSEDEAGGPASPSPG